jgi:hypothetical protein
MTEDANEIHVDEIDDDDDAGDEEKQKQPWYKRRNPWKELLSFTKDKELISRWS